MPHSIEIEIHASKSSAQDRAEYFDARKFQTTVYSCRDATWDNKLKEADAGKYPDVASQDDGSDVWVLIATR